MTACDAPTEVIHLDRVEISAEPWSWEFATARRVEINEYFASLQRKRSAVWNGRVLLLKHYLIRDSMLLGSCFETDYASFIAWRHWNCPDPTVFNFFAAAALRSADGDYLVGEMAPYTAAAGRLYFPAGTPDPSDIDARGTFNLIDHLNRELREETGIAIDELDVEPGWALVRERCRVALIRRLVSRETADNLQRRVTRHITSERQPELSDVRIVRGPAQLDARMPTFVTTFLQEQWRQRALDTGTLS
jgi:8-oxo-dGTP pyrophosphatase MutT (NUDIX family)